MAKRVANYQDPKPGKMGWEVEGLTQRKLLLQEKREAEASPIVCGVAYASQAAEIPPAILSLLKLHNKFDAGFSFYTVAKLVYGIHLMIAQNIGNCVGASHCYAIAYRIAYDILCLGQLEEPLGKENLSMPLIAYSYGVGRDAAGIRGGGDGSTCQGQFDGTKKHGFLPCFMVSDKFSNLPQGSAAEGRKLGSSIKHCEPYFAMAEKYAIEEAPQVRNAEEAWTMIAEKHRPIQACSGVGFKHKSDSKYGDLYVMGGSWSHSMQIPAAFEFKGARFFAIGNQWGFSSHTGNEEMGIPPGSMVVTWDTADKYLRKCHALAVGDIQGLKSTMEFV